VAVKPTVTLKPFVLIVVPGYNEAYIVARNLRGICEYMERLEVEYKWKLIFVNDGSTGVDLEQGLDKEVRF
jgi:glycosyltransferase involved in cell wall biosynthesis